MRRAQLDARRRYALNVTGGIHVDRFDPLTGEYETLHEIVPRLGAAIAPLGEVTEARVVVIGGVDPATGNGAEFVEVLDAASTTDRQYEMFFEPQMARVGLSATQKPIEEVARFLTSEPVAVVDKGHKRQIDLAVEVPSVAVAVTR